jgi:glycosyltransferase involved in cell wall biosynthesis
MGDSISLLIPTISRPTLARSLMSCLRQTWNPGDEIILIGDGPNPQARELWDQFHGRGLPGRYIEVPRTPGSGDWGHTPRNLVMGRAMCSYLMALDDDDILTANAVSTVRAAIRNHPGRPLIFRMDWRAFGGTYKWEVPELIEGNVGTPMFVTPNDSSKIGRYSSRYGGDFDFIRDTCAFYADGPVFLDDVICITRPVFAQMGGSLVR